MYRNAGKTELSDAYCETMIFFFSIERWRVCFPPKHATLTLCSQGEGSKVKPT